MSSAVPVWFPNPHAVAFVDSLDVLDAVLPQPTVTPIEVFPDGANFEFAVVIDAEPRRVPGVRARCWRNGVMRNRCVCGGLGVSPAG